MTVTKDKTTKAKAVKTTTSKAKASKGTIIATSKCTPNVTKLIEECEYKMSYEYLEEIDVQIYDNSKKDIGSKLQF